MKLALKSNPEKTRNIDRYAPILMSILKIYIACSLLKETLFLYTYVSNNTRKSNLNESVSIDFEEIISPFDEMVAYETLWAINGMTEKKLTELFKDHNELPTEVLRSLHPPLVEDANLKALEQEVRRFLNKKIGSYSVCVYRDFQYPLDLRKMKNPIELFYYKGNLDLLSNRSISVVGARSASDDGLKRASRIARELVKNNFTVVSGLAKGIDFAAQSSAIRENGSTIGVVGTPIDAYYPKENRSLQEEIARKYLLISQVPFYRYANESFNAHKYYFPRRNATMAAISEGTVIVEASEKSGTLTQARACIQQGKKLFILDSCFENKSITWPSYYASKGAIRVKKVEDILENLPESNMPLSGE